MFKLPTFFLLTLAIAGCQSSPFRVTRSPETFQDDSGVPLGVRFHIVTPDHPVSLRGLTTYCANGQPSDTSMSEDIYWQLPQKGFWVITSDLGRPLERTYYLDGYKGVSEVLQEVCKVTEEDQD